jgi:hypothetical protein
LFDVEAINHLDAAILSATVVWINLSEEAVARCLPAENMSAHTSLARLISMSGLLNREQE